jgi:5-methylcytosine-specific restriction endonuclease McrA
MIKHKKIYIDYFGYETGDVIPCEVCLYDFNKNKEGVVKDAVDIHHISARKMGGSKLKDYPENLMALCRSCHIEAENSKKKNNRCKIIHLKKIIKMLEE